MDARALTTAHAHYELEAGATEIGPYLTPTKAPNRPPWKMEWAVLFRDGYFFKVIENWFAIAGSDAAVLLRAAPTERFFADLIMREILCKPIRLTVVKAEARLTEADAPLLFSAAQLSGNGGEEVEGDVES